MSRQIALEADTLAFDTSELELRILRALSRSEWYNAEDIYRRSKGDDSKHTISHSLRTLISRGLLERRGEKKGIEYRLTRWGAAEVGNA